MKPATSLCCRRESAGTRRCTSSKPASARRQTPPTTKTPYTTVGSKVRTPLLDPTGRYSSRYYRHCTNFSEVLEANLSELRKAEVPRIHLPRTLVNKGKEKGLVV